MLMGALTRRAIADMEHGLIALVDELLDSNEAEDGGDLIDHFASAIPAEIIGNLLGVPHADRASLRHWSLAILGATNLIGNALVALQEFPGARTELLSKQELLTQYLPGLEAYFSSVIDEFLRFESSNQLGNRRALKAARVGNIDIAAGSRLTQRIGAANRAPLVFERPDQLDFGRQSNRQYASGFGIHQCAGMNWRGWKAALRLGRFLQRFPRFQLNASPVRDGRARFRRVLSAPFTLR